MIRFALALALVSCCAAQELKFAALGDLRLQSGETIRDCRIGYRTFGTLDAERSNAILFPTWFSGKTEDLIPLFGPGKLVDTSRYFVIAVDALGNGVSSSPSNSQAQAKWRFPRFTIGDMVNSQYRLVTEVLGLKRLHAVMGISMGGMQTFEWMVAYPDFMARAIPIVGTPSQTSYDLMLWTAEADAIRRDPAWRYGQYEAQPASGLATVAAIHSLAISTPQHRNRETPVKDAAAFMTKSALDVVRSSDANDWLRQLEAMMLHNIGRSGTLESVAGKVKAKALIVVASQDHMVNPGPSLAFAKALKAEVIELTGDCGHLAPSCEQQKAYPAVSRFLTQ